MLHFLVLGTGTVFRIRFRFRFKSLQMNTVPTGSGSGSATLLPPHPPPPPSVGRPSRKSAKSFNESENRNQRVLCIPFQLELYGQHIIISQKWYCLIGLLPRICQLVINILSGPLILILNNKVLCCFTPKGFNLLKAYKNGQEKHFPPMTFKSSFPFSWMIPLMCTFLFWKVSGRDLSFFLREACKSGRSFND